MSHSLEQVTHDEVNLVRLVRRLEKSIAVEKDWDDAAVTGRERVWLQALGTLQKVKHGRKLLRNLEQYGPEPSPKQTRQRVEIEKTLDRVELFMTEVQKRTEPPQRKFEPILSRIPVPVFNTDQPDLSIAMPGERPGAKEVEGEKTTLLSNNITHEESFRLRDSVKGGASEALIEDNTSLFPSNERSPPPPASFVSPVSSLLPATPTPGSFSTSTSTAISTSSNNTLTTRKHLQTSNTLHEDLSNQLAQMATQLKRNAEHFSASLAKDKAVVEETQEKLEGNFTVMLKERLRVRDFRSNSRSTTWLVVGVVLVVLLLFVIMVGVIRFSRR